jgi:hypothetical protein
VSIRKGDRVAYRKWRDDWQEGGRPFIGTVKDAYASGRERTNYLYIHWPNLGIHTTERAWMVSLMEQA